MILFVGPFAPPYKGDGVKNSTLQEGFKFLGYRDIVYFDTIRRKGGALAYYWDLLKKLSQADKIIFSLNRNGRNVLLPLFFLLQKVRKRRQAILYVIGGSFHTQIKKMNPFLKKMFIKVLKRLDGIYVESNIMLKGLIEFGLDNCEVVFNPRKNLNFQWKLTNDNLHRVLFLSRVTATKGVFDLAEAVLKLKSEGVENIKLDIVGPMDEGCREQVNNLLIENMGIINYKGEVEPGDVQRLMLNYHVFALPTFHPGEGLPGVLVEAGFVGLPVITTRINSLTEYFEDYKSVRFVDTQNVDQLSNVIYEVFNGDNEDLNQLSKGITEAVSQFSIEKVIQQSVELLNQKGWEMNKYKNN